MKFPARLVGSPRTALMLLAGALLWAMVFLGVLYGSSPSHAEDGALLTGNHPAEANSLAQMGAPSLTAPLTMRIHFALRNRAALEKLLADQQDPKSPDYHQWLTPEQFTHRFGPTPAQIEEVSRWLASEGFTVTGRGRSSLEFTGTTATAQSAFAVHIASFGDGSVYANTTDPVIPRRLSGVIAAVEGLDNMAHAYPMNHGVAAALVAQAGSTALGEAAAAPDAIVNGWQSFGPGDLRSFYDETVTSGRDGTGRCIALVGESDLPAASISAFNNQFGLPATSYTTKQLGQYPGYNSAQAEAELDLEWSHVAAPGAALVYYLGYDIIGDLAGAVNDNACGVINASYGLCGVSSSYMTGVIDPILAQGAAQGQSVFISAGDQGAAGITLNPAGNQCVVGAARNVNELSADPNVTSVGGTRFTPNFVGGSDQGYTSESAWSDQAGATGGGVSRVFAKPSWQSGAGVPAGDGYREVPDISLIASPDSPGVFFADNGQVVCCIGGTSLSAPVWAGFATVIDQIAGERLGNFNPIIYQLANTRYASAGFHDVAVGNNNFNGVSGYNAGPGFDLATGWGTIDFNLFAAAVVSLKPGPTPTRTATPRRAPTPIATPTPTRTAGSATFTNG